MIYLGGVELNQALVWENRFSTPTTMSSNLLLLDGTTRILQSSIQTGRVIILQASQDQGWLTKTQVDLLTTLSNALGNAYTLDYEGDLYTVVFDHGDGAAVSFSPLVPRANQADADYLIGTIHLLTI